MSFKYDTGSWDDEPQAQKDWYNGIEFRSKLESKTAQALDNIGIAYEYEPDGYKLSNGMWYRPDFYLPAQRQYIECKGVMSETDSAKIYGLVEDTGRQVIALSYTNSMVVMREWNNPLNEIVTYSGDDIVLAECCRCGGLWFLCWPDTYECTCCGSRDGDHHFRVVKTIASATDLFNFGQGVAADKPIYKEIANNFNG